jgi:hypothetical protein
MSLHPRFALVVALVAFALLAPAAQAVPPFLSAWGTKGAGDGQFDTPDGLATDSAGRVFVADRSNDRVQVFLADGTFQASWKADLGLRSPYGVAVDDRGSVYVIDNGNNQVVQLNLLGGMVRTWGTKGVGDGQFDDPRGIGVGPDGTVYVADHGNNRVQAFTADGQFVRKWGRNGGDGSEGSAPGEFHDPYGIAVDCRGGRYVSDEENDRIQRFGDPTAPFPSCAPAVQVTSVRAGARGASLRALCDRACSLYATAKAGVDGAKPVAVKAGTALMGGRPDRLTLRYPAGLRRAVHRGRAQRLTLRISAVGMGGAAPTVVKQVAL